MRYSQQKWSWRVRLKRWSSIVGWNESRSGRELVRASGMASGADGSQRG